MYKMQISPSTDTYCIQLKAET